jgi:O-antigen/teichoic acid export membrane protein
MVLFSTIMLRATTFVLTIFFANNLEKSQFGLFMMYRNTASLLESFISNTFGNQIIIDGAKGPSNKNSLLTIVIISGVFTLFCLLLYIILLYIGFVDSTIELYDITLIVILTLLMSISSCFQKMMIGNSWFKAYLKSILISVLLFCIIFFVSSILGYGDIKDVNRGLEVFILLYATLLTLQFYYLIKKNCSLLASKISKKITSQVLHLKYIWLSTVVSSGFLWIIKVFISSTENGLIVIAEFEVTYLIVTLIMLVTGAVINVATKNMASEPHSGILKYLSTNLTIVIIISITFYLFYPYLQEVISQKYAVSDWILLMTTIYMIVLTSENIYYRSLLVRNEYKPLFVIKLFSALFTAVFFMAIPDDYFNVTVMYTLFILFSIVNLIGFVICDAYSKRI